MNKLFLLFLLFFSSIASSQPLEYLQNVKEEFQKDWPKNRTVNIVFHGHSVPCGYFKTPIVNSLLAYPHLTFENIKKIYPKAVVNVITTAIGGENSEQGQKRFEYEVLNHDPDVIFIDYALNDRSIGLERAEIAWEKMIQAALEKGIKVILMTPSPDKRNELFDTNSELQLHADQIKNLANRYNVGLVDSYRAFQEAVKNGVMLNNLMSTNNHPNESGHKIISSEVFRFFK